MTVAVQPSRTLVEMTWSSNFKQRVIIVSLIRLQATVSKYIPTLLTIPRKMLRHYPPIHPRAINTTMPRNLNLPSISLRPTCGNSSSSLSVLIIHLSNIVILPLSLLILLLLSKELSFYPFLPSLPLPDSRRRPSSCRAPSKRAGWRR